MRDLAARLARLEDHFAADDCTCGLPMLVVIEPEPIPTLPECPVHAGKSQATLLIRRFSFDPADLPPEWRRIRLESAHMAVQRDPYWTRVFGAAALEKAYGGVLS